MKNKNLIFKLLISFVMVFAVAFSFALKTDLHTAEATGEKTVTVYNASSKNNGFSVPSENLTTISTLRSYLYANYGQQCTADNTYFYINGTLYAGTSEETLLANLPEGETSIYFYLENSTIDITFKYENGTKATDFEGLSVSPLTTVSQVRTALEQAKEYNVYQAQFKLNDVVLEDSKSLASYGFKSGDTITVIVPHIDFTPTAVYTGNYTQTTTNDTLLLGNSTTKQVTVQYKVVANTGINNLVLVPSYDKAVFSIAQNGVTVNSNPLGGATVTNNYYEYSNSTEEDAIPLRIALESETTYSGKDVILVTIVFDINAAAANDGEYVFGLKLEPTDEEDTYNDYSNANVFETEEKLGEQKPVEIRIVLNSTTPENVVKILKERTAEIEIGYEHQENDNKYYDFVYGTEFSVTGPVALGDQPETSAESIKYSYHETEKTDQLSGDVFTITWYEANLEGNKYVPGSKLDAQPTAVGTYMVGIKAAQNGVYLPVAEQYRVVKIDTLSITVTIDNKTSVYLCPLSQLSANYTAEQLAGFGYTLSTTATSTSPVGGYAITLSGNGNENFDVNWEPATYTITALKITVAADAQQSKYGEEINVDQSKYTISYTNETGNPDIEIAAYQFAVTLTKDPAGVNVGTYDIVPSVTACAGAYNLASFEFHYDSGIYTITSASGLDLAYFTADEVVYDGQSHDLLIVATNKPSYITGYTATNNNQTNVGTYTIQVTVTIDAQTAENYGCATSLPVVVNNAKITPAAITIKADNKGHTYGSTPVTNFTYQVTSGEIYGSDNLNVACGTEQTMTSTTDVGEYTIALTASNSNYAITCVSGKYTVSKAGITDTNEDNIPDDTDEGSSTPTTGVKISVSASDVYYNRDLSYTAKVMVGNVVLTSGYTVSVELVEATGTTELAGVRKAGQYKVVVSLAGTDNYVAATKSATFTINKIALGEINITYSAYNKATWAGITKDSGGVDLVTGTQVTYAQGIYDEQNNYYYFIPAEELGYDEFEEFKYFYEINYHPYNNDNYISNKVTLNDVIEIEFKDYKTDHERDNIDPQHMPEKIVTFVGTGVPSYPMPDPNTPPTLPGYTFAGWVADGDDYKTSWTINKYDVTLKFTEASETLNTDMFTVEAEYKGTIQFTKLPNEPTKAGTPGISYNYNGKVAYNSAEYTAAYSNGTLTVTGYSLTGDGVVFVAQYNAVNNAFTIYYYVKTTPDAQDYTPYQTVENVEYNSDIAYLTNPIQARQWFKVNPWALANGNAAPAKMPAEDLKVYSEVVFDIGQGDVNGNKAVTTDDITLYRQMIVGGYEMTVVAAGNEWNAAENYNKNTRYFLVGVADNNGDTSKDIRDVSVTRMALVGGYTWVIEHGVRVTGDDIVRSTRVTSVADLMTALTTTNKKVSIIADINDAEDFVVSPSKDLYLDLCGHTLTVNSFVVSTTTSAVTLTIKNGTIVTTNGITISAPNGDVVLTDLVGYVNNNPVNLAAGSNSLHINGLVEFRNGTTETSTYAPVTVAGGTHLVVEEKSNIIAKKLVVPANETISIKNDSVEATAIVVEGTYTVDTASVVANFVYTTENLTDISTESELAAATGNCRLVADIEVNNNNGIDYNKNVTINLNGHDITFKKWGFNVVSNGTLTLNGKGNVSSVEATLCAQGGGIIVINGGTYSATDNFVAGTQGSANNGGSSITINAGTFNGTITSAGYVACGIYVANSDTVVVNGGTFNITNGVGILARSGNTTVKSGVVFNVTGDGTLGKVGDSKVTVPSGEVLVLDLKAGYPGGVPTLNNNTKNDVYVVVDGTYTFVNDDASFHAARGVYDNVILDADLSDYLYVTRDMNLYLNGHTVDAHETEFVAIYVVNGAKLTINGEGNVIATEGCVLALDGSTFEINGGTYTCYDNFVFGTNGTGGRGGNTITINAGTFNGEITSDGYVACGIYVANSDTVVVNGGTFNITNGVGILARSGNTTVNGGTFNVTGDSTLGKVGDSQVTVPAGQVLVLDLKANYPGGTPTLTNNTQYDIYTIEK